MEPLKGHAFIGVSLDSRLFDHLWVRKAILAILGIHETLTIVIADDLLKYTRSMVAGVLDYRQIGEYISERKSESSTFFTKEIKKLPTAYSSRVRVSDWSEFSDNQYNVLLKNLLLARACVPAFRDSVYKTAYNHFLNTMKNHEVALDQDSFIASSELLIIDELAMAIRIAELTEFSFEYYPGPQLPVFEELYSNEFSTYGLTVESLTGASKQRKFTNLGHIR